MKVHCTCRIAYHFLRITILVNIRLLNHKSDPSLYERLFVYQSAGTLSNLLAKCGIIVKLCQHTLCNSSIHLLVLLYEQLRYCHLDCRKAFCHTHLKRDFSSRRKSCYYDLCQLEYQNSKQEWRIVVAKLERLQIFAAIFRGQRSTSVVTGRIKTVLEGIDRWCINHVDRTEQSAVNSGMICDTTLGTGRLEGDGR